MTAGISLLAQNPQCWEVLPGPAHIGQVPLPAPSVSVATGTSILQLTEPLTWCLSFSIWGWFLLLCSALPALPLLGLSPVVEAMCLGQKKRWWAPGPLDAAPSVPAEPHWDEPASSTLWTCAHWGRTFPYSWAGNSPSFLLGKSQEKPKAWVSGDSCLLQRCLWV